MKFFSKLPKFFLGQMGVCITIFSILAFFLVSCNKESLETGEKSHLNHDVPNLKYGETAKHESVAQIMSSVLGTSAGKDILLQQLSENIIHQTDSTLSGIYSIPLLYLLDKSSAGQHFFALWNSYSSAIDTTCTAAFLIEEYIPNNPGMGVSIYDPFDRQEKYLSDLDFNFTVAIINDNRYDSCSVYRNGTFLGRVDLDEDPENMTIVLFEEEGYWMLKAEDLQTPDSFFSKTGINLSSTGLSYVASLNRNPYRNNNPTISLGIMSYDNPLYDYYLITREDVSIIHNDICNGTTTNNDVVIRSGGENCDRDDWLSPNLVERIIRFRTPTSATAGVIASKNRCKGGWFTRYCNFLIIAYIPQYGGNLSDLDETFHGRPLQQIFTAVRKKLKNTGWITTNSIRFDQYLYLEGRMGEYWIFEIIQQNKDAGKEVTISANLKFSSGIKFIAKGVGGGDVETTRNVETSAGISVKWTEKDWPLGNSVVRYCDCQTCNGNYGDTYSVGQIEFSVRECSSFPQCL